MGFVMNGLNAEDYDRTYGDATLVRRIIAYFRPHAGAMAVVISMVLLSSLSQTVLPIVIARGIDMLGSNPSTRTIVLLASGAVLLGGLGWVFNYMRQIFGARTVGNVVLKLREDAFTAVTERDLSFYDQYLGGKIVSRVTSDTQDFSNVVTLTLDLASQLVLVVIISIVLFIIEPGLALLTLAIAPVIMLAALAFRRVARWTSQRARRMTAEVNATVQESVSGISVAKSFRQEASIYDAFRNTNQLTYKVRLQQGLVFNTIFPVLDILTGIGTAVVIYFGGMRVLEGSVSAGDWYLFLRSLAIFYIPLTSIASFWSQFQQGLASSERVFALIDAEPRVIQTGHEPMKQVRGDLTFEHVHFAYKEDEPVLRDFSLAVPAGQKLAIVGHTGAGKSSLVRLLTRFYEFQAGTIAIDGRDVRRLDLAQYRRYLGLVPQSPFLFSGTVADNIRYGRPEASEEDIRRAAQRLGDEWLDELPEGLQTDVGERGGSLSLGQRQLVALARVLLRDPSIFILDEATASVDPFTEAQIQTGLDIVMQGRTSIVIAHRLSTVKSADRIIVMRAGQIIEEGSHEALLAQGGHYAELYTTYFRHQSLEYVEQVGAYA
jgi:ABC-type multidrug transport system fused ATPase/permease subunit